MEKNQNSRNGQKIPRTWKKVKSLLPADSHFQISAKVIFQISAFFMEFSASTARLLNSFSMFVMALCIHTNVPLLLYFSFNVYRPILCHIDKQFAFPVLYWGKQPAFDPIPRSISIPYLLSGGGLPWLGPSRYLPRLCTSGVTDNTAILHYSQASVLREVSGRC